MNRINILNELIKKHGFTKFCEIGTQAGHCLNGVNCEIKVGVDPDRSSAANIFLTSDEYFKQNKEIDFVVEYPDRTGFKVPKKFNIYWIDGLHHSDTVYRDILNAFDALEEGGFVCCHDMLPTNYHMTEIPLTDQDSWTGDCYKAFVKLRTERDDIQFTVVDTDWGCAILRKGSSELLKISEPIEYEGFVKNRNHWMNVISVAEFKQKFLD